MKALYQSADVLVSPSRAEGFGLPIFEAAEHGVPSIVTAWGGPMDLCDAENSWLLDFEFTKADSHLPVYDSVWAEPDVAQLSDLLKDVVSMDLSIRQARAAKLKARVDQCSRWSHVMQRHLDFVNGLVQDSQHLRPRIGWITTYGERCGIATYTDALISHMRAPPAVVLCRRGTEPPKSESHDLTDVTVLPSWDDRGFDGVIEAVKQYDLQAVVIQFVYPFYDYDAFASLIAELSAMGCVLVLELHESEPPAYAESKHLKHLRDTLLLFDRILVHSVSAMNDLKAIGVTEHVSLFPHGVKVLSQDSLTQPPASVRQRLARARQDNRVQIIGSYGFFLPHKGFTDLIESVAALRAEGFALHLVLMTAEYPAPASRVAIEEARRLIEVLDLHSHVTLVTEFLADEDSSAALKACDVLVFPYRYTEQGASGAVRYGLACDVPVVTSDLPFFDELGASVRRIRAGNVEHMTQDLKVCLLDVQNQTPEIQAQLDVARDWVRNHSYGVLAKRLYGMVTALTRLKLRTFDA